MIKLKRIYDPAEDSDGQRVLVDRLWPRGISKQQASLDEWLKDVAPSNELRQWFKHQPDRFAEFKRRYQAELKGNDDVKQLAKLANQGDMTLLYAAKDTENNQAVVLKQYLEND